MWVVLVKSLSTNVKVPPIAEVRTGEGGIKGRKRGGNKVRRWIQYKSLELDTKEERKRNRKKKKKKVTIKLGKSFIPAS